ncbi:hypothetical protein P4U97_15405 [Bacillus swezeyi]|uniref:hypothetical protein n=1 Tax=Bacillus swezeyi TaxID=1925020 RepID=UPI002E20AB53|nr:hypothetical protein [Bacillus swezeyi]
MKSKLLLTAAASVIGLSLTSLALTAKTVDMNIAERNVTSIPSKPIHIAERNVTSIPSKQPIQIAERNVT